MIKLKNIKYYPELSEETFCFTADVYNNQGHLIATIKNNGKGEANNVYPNIGFRSEVNVIDLELSKLPPRPIEFNGETFFFKRSFEDEIDRLFSEALELQKVKVIQ